MELPQNEHNAKVIRAACCQYAPKLGAFSENVARVETLMLKYVSTFTSILAAGDRLRCTIGYFRNSVSFALRIVVHQHRTIELVYTGTSADYIDGNPFGTIPCSLHPEDVDLLIFPEMTFTGIA